MATRFHFRSTGSIKTTTNPAFDAGWEQTGEATRLPMNTTTTEDLRTAFATSSAITIPITTSQEILAYQFVSDEVFRPVRLDNTNFWRLIINCAENANTNNAFISASIRAFSPDGARDLGTIISKFGTGGTEFPLTASRATRIAVSTTIPGLTLSEPFRIVTEIGAFVNGPTAAGSYTLRIGNPTTIADYAYTSALTTDLCTWWDITKNLEAFENVRSNNYGGFTTEGSNAGVVNVAVN